MKNITLKVGRKYKLRHSHSAWPHKELIHIDSIIDDPTDKDGKIITYRVWNKYRRSWYWYASELWLIQMYNARINLYTESNKH